MTTTEPDRPDPELPETRSVRPYTMTGGRTRPRRAYLPIEALVRRVGTGPTDGLDGQLAASVSPERRGILDLTTDAILSVAEISAYLALPLGVVRVLVGDLADCGRVVVHAGRPPSQQTPAENFKVLESVLDGISAL